jgi:Calcineurin-like phosphoesterase
VSEAVFVVGDVHGHREKLVGLLRDAGLIDAAERWHGADARLWLLGDLVDRGPDGLGAIELVMRLAREGDVRCLLGNHEALLLGAHRFADQPVWEAGPTFGDAWLVNGGQLADLSGLRPEHVAWLAERPAIAREGDWLVLHADTDRYLELGRSVEDVNRAARKTLSGSDGFALGTLLDCLGDRLVLDDAARRSALLEGFGAQRVIHGHTPIAIVRNCDPSLVIEPMVYGDGLVFNVDHCLFGGGPGFVTRLDLL